MKGRVEQILEEIKVAAEMPEPQRSELLRKRLSHKQPLVVLAVVKVVRARKLTAFASDLDIALGTMIGSPASDPGCTIKMLILDTLRDFDAITSGILHRAVRHHQMEPVYGGSVDVAAPMRAWAAYRLGESGDGQAMPALCELLFETPRGPSVQDEVSPRIAAIRVLGQYRHDSATLMLRAKMLAGDRSDEVVGETVGALFSTGITWAEPLVEAALSSLTDDALSAAAISIGEQRSSRAAALLLRRWRFIERTAAAEAWLLGLALTRQDEAVEFLLKHISEAAPSIAQQAVKALEQFSSDRLREQIVAAVAARGDNAVKLKM